MRGRGLRDEESGEAEEMSTVQMAKVTISGTEDPRRELDFLKWLIEEARKKRAERQQDKAA